MDLTLYKFLALCKCGEVHICMNCVSSIQSFLAKNKNSIKTKANKQSIVFLSVCDLLALRWEITKSDHFFVRFVSSKRLLAIWWWDISEQTRDKNKQSNAINCVHHRTYHAIIWRARFSRERDLPMCEPISVEKVTVYLSCLKTHKS